MVGSCMPCWTWFGLNQVNLVLPGSVHLELNWMPSGIRMVRPRMKAFGRFSDDGSFVPGI